MIAVGRAVSGLEPFDKRFPTIVQLNNRHEQHGALTFVEKQWNMNNVHQSRDIRKIRFFCQILACMLPKRRDRNSNESLKLQAISLPGSCAFEEEKAVAFLLQRSDKNSNLWQRQHTWRSRRTTIPIPSCLYEIVDLRYLYRDPDWEAWTWNLNRDQLPITGIGSYSYTVQSRNSANHCLAGTTTKLCWMSRHHLRNEICWHLAS